MHASTLRGFLEHLRQLTDPARRQDLSDGDLLDRFRLNGEESAFTLLLQRHGPMVFNICRRILGDGPEAEDAFQAAFLVLLRKAGTIRKEAALSSWLHVVATHIALKARRRSADPSYQPADAGRSPVVHDDPSETLAAKELRMALDEEIARLPDKYRMPLVLCYLAEKTYEQAARELGWPKSSLAARLTKARQLLQQRLMRRGFTAPAGLLAALLTEQAVHAAVPSLLTLSTVKLAVQALSGKTLAATSAAALAGSFVKQTATLKIAGALALLATLGFAAIGYRMTVFDPSSPSEPKIKAPGEPRAANPKPREPRLDFFGDPLPNEAVARMGSSRMRHPSRTKMTIAFSTDGKTLATGTGSGARIWDATTGKLRWRFDVSSDWPPSFAFTKDGLLIASAGSEKNIITLQLFDPASGKVRQRLGMLDRIAGAAAQLSTDGKWLSYVLENDLRLCDTASWRELLRLTRGGWFAFAADGKTAARFNFSDTVSVYDLGSGQCTRRLKHEGGNVHDIAVSADGRYLASISAAEGAATEQIIIWDLQTGKARHRLKSGRGGFFKPAFSPDGKFVAVGGTHTNVLLFDVETGKEVRRYPPDAEFANIAFSPDGKKLAAMTGGGVIRLWETATSRVLPASADPMLEYVRELRFSADGKRLLGQTGNHFAWEPETGRELRRFPKMSGECYWIAALAPDESLLITADDDGAIHLWDAKKGRKVRDLKGHEKRIWSAIFSADGRRLASSSLDETIRVWDVESGRELHKLSDKGGLTLNLAFSPDGHWLASASEKRGPRGHEVILWDLTTGREKSRFVMVHDNSTDQLAFSPDSRLLAAVGGGSRASRPGEVQVWDVTGERRRRWFEGHKSGVLSVAFSPDNRTMATGDYSGELFLWESASGRRRHRFVGHESGIHSLAFSADGRLLAASSSDAPVLVWDVRGAFEHRRRLSDDELRRCWTALAGEDASTAFESIRRLAAAPEQSMTLLRQHLKPVSAPDRQRVRQLVDMLDSGDFQTRQKAAVELEKQSDATASILRQILMKEKPSLEVRRRLQQIVEGIESKPESLRAVRAVEVLEWIATPDAVHLIDELVKGVADARLTREAVSAKSRLRR